MRRTVKQFYTPAEYLAMEAVAEYKSEYYDGQIYALAGGTSDHSVIAVNIVSHLEQQLRAGPCRVFNSDMRLLVRRSGLYTYPDAMVVCGKLEFVERRKDTLTNPVLIVEVLSESTRDNDRGQKSNFYKQIPSLQDYVLVESEFAQVEHYRRTPDDQWVIETYTDLGAELRLDSLGLQISLQRIYAKALWLE